MPFFSDNRRFFNLAAPGYDFITAQPLWRAQIRRGLERVTDPTGVRRVLDLGCGPGVSSFVVAEALPAASVVGVDISEQMIARARRHHRRHPELPNLSFHQGDVYDLCFEKDCFDLVLGHSFLYLLPERSTALKAIASVLCPGGQLILLEPARSGSLTKALRSTSHTSTDAFYDRARFATSMVLWQLVSKKRGQLDESELIALFEEAGLADVHVYPTLGGLGFHATGHRRR